jgi:hypothetical protein
MESAAQITKKPSLLRTGELAKLAKRGAQCPIQGTAVTLFPQLQNGERRREVRRRQSALHQAWQQ